MPLICVLQSYLQSDQTQHEHPISCNMTAFYRTGLLISDTVRLYMVAFLIPSGVRFGCVSRSIWLRFWCVFYGCVFCAIQKSMVAFWLRFRSDNMVAFYAFSGCILVAFCAFLRLSFWCVLNGCVLCVFHRCVLVAFCDLIIWLRFQRFLVAFSK